MFGNLPPEAMGVMHQMLKAQMPGLKTQAQFNTFMAAFDALRLHLNDIFEMKDSTKSRQTLEQALDLAEKVTDVVDKYTEVPEAQGAASKPFVEPPKEFAEYDVHKKLLLELEALITYVDFKNWYEATKEDRNKVVSQNLRNSLLDTIRAKAVSLMVQDKGSPLDERVS